MIKYLVKGAVYDISGITEMDIFLGYDWLEKHNPEIDWKKERSISQDVPRIVT